MKRFLLYSLFLVVFAFSAPLSAQDDPFLPVEPTQPSAMGEVSDEPSCFNVINRAPYTVFGSIYTNYFIRGDGAKTRHKSNFRLETENSAEFCTYGPFYDDRKVELVLRTLIPIFDCKTGVDGDVIIYGRRKSEGGTETWATCL